MNIFENLDASTLLHWTVEDGSSAMRASIAMLRIHDYLAGAHSQIERIWASLKQVRSGDDDWSSLQQQAFVDVHFYFVTWDAITKMMRVIVDSSGFDSARQVYERHNRTIGRYQKARHHLEHYDERLPGGRKTKTLNKPGDLGNISNDKYTFGGETWDIGIGSYEELVKIVEEFENAIREEGIKRYNLKISED